MSFHHQVFKRSVIPNNHFEVKGAEYVYACVKEKCTKVKDFEIQENVTASCNDQNLLISFEHTDDLNHTQRVDGYLTQEKGAPMTKKQLTTNECKLIKK